MVGRKREYVNSYIKTGSEDVEKECDIQSWSLKKIKTHRKIRHLPVVLKSKWACELSFLFHEISIIMMASEYQTYAFFRS